MPQEIAIIGMACKAPKADNYQDFWQLLVAGETVTGGWPEGRRHLSRLWSGPDAGFAGKASNFTNSMRGGYLDDVDMFDARLFGISPREARLMDPQHRLLMEQSWQALLDAAIDPRTLAGSQTGVFFGLCSHDYGLIGHEMPERVSPYSALGAAHCIASNHVSYSLGFHGPSITVDAACAASAMAIHLGVQSLLCRECDLALAGGGNLVLAPGVNISFQMAEMLSSQGRCATFDRGADGYVRGEAIGVIALKRLEDAGNDPIHAVISATASNQDGKSSSITVPSGAAQEALLRRCYDKAGISPDAVTFVEAHGTGTPVGDPIEAEALSRVFSGRETPCRIASLKANFGHAEAAAGVLSTIKTALALRSRVLPPHVGAAAPIAPFDSDGASIALVTEGERLPADTDSPIFGGVSAFGFGGTNVHMLLRNHETEGHRKSYADDGPATIILSAHSVEALEEARKSWADYFASLDAPDFHLVAAMTRRACGGERVRIEVAATFAREAAAALRGAPIASNPSGTKDEFRELPIRRRPASPPPTYPFMRKRFWAYDYGEGPRSNAEDRANSATEAHDAFPEMMALDFSADYIANHRIAQTVVVPGASIMMAIRTALLPYCNGDALEIRDMHFRSAIIVDPAAGAESAGTTLRLTREADNAYRVTVLSEAGGVVRAECLAVRKAL